MSFTAAGVTTPRKFLINPDQGPRIGLGGDDAEGKLGFHEGPKQGCLDPLFC